MFKLLKHKNSFQHCKARDVYNVNKELFVTK